MRILIIFILFFFPLTALSENTIGLLLDDEGALSSNLKFYTTAQVLEPGTKVYALCGVEYFCISVTDIPNTLTGTPTDRITSEKPIYEYTLNKKKGESYNEISQAWLNNEAVGLYMGDPKFPDGSLYTMCYNDGDGLKYTYKNAKGEEMHLYYADFNTKRDEDNQCLASNKIFTLNHLEKSKISQLGVIAPNTIITLTESGKPYTIMEPTVVFLFKKEASDANKHRLTHFAFYQPDVGEVIATVSDEFITNFYADDPALMNLSGDLKYQDFILKEGDEYFALNSAMFTPPREYGSTPEACTEPRGEVDGGRMTCSTDSLLVNGVDTDDGYSSIFEHEMIADVITILDDKIPTARGISVGASTDEVIEKYGLKYTRLTPTPDEYGYDQIFEYKLKGEYSNKTIAFEFDNNVVTKIIYTERKMSDRISDTYNRYGTLEPEPK